MSFQVSGLSGIDSLVLACPRSSTTLRPNGRNLPPAKQAVIAHGDIANRRQDLDSKEASQMSHSKLKLNIYNIYTLYIVSETKWRIAVVHLHNSIPCPFIAAL